MEEQNTMRKSPKRLLINIDDQMHEKIKLVAVKRNITIRKWVTRVLLKALLEEQKRDE